MRNVFASLVMVLAAASGALGGSIVDCRDATSLQEALDDARPGDTIRVVGRIGNKTQFTYSRSGTATSPITLTGKPGTSPAISGYVIPKQNTKSDYFQVVGDLLIDGGGDTPVSCYQMTGVGQAAINLTFVNCNPKNTILSNDFTGQTIEGNVIRDSDHGLYIQNTFAANGYKVARRNIYLPNPQCRSNCYAFHGYSESGSNSGLDLEQSIFAGARNAIIGGRNPTTKHEKVIDNVWWKGAGLQLGYANGCAQVDAFRGNVFLRAPVQLDPLCSDADPNSIGPNQFYPSPGGATMYSIRYRDAAKTQTKANPRDAWPGDTFLVPAGTSSIGVTFWFEPTGGNDCCKSSNLAKFAAQLKLVGVPSPEAGASTVAAPPSPRSWLFGNDHEAGRGELAVLVWNGTGPTAVGVDLAPVTSVGSNFTITRAEDMPYGAPVLAGVYQGGLVQVPITGEFQTYVLRAGSAAARTPTPQAAP